MNSQNSCSLAKHWKSETELIVLFTCNTHASAHMCIARAICSHYTYYFNTLCLNFTARWIRLLRLSQQNISRFFRNSSAMSFMKCIIQYDLILQFKFIMDPKKSIELCRSSICMTIIRPFHQCYVSCLSPYLSCLTPYPDSLHNDIEHKTL